MELLVDAIVIVVGGFCAIVLAVLAVAVAVNVIVGIPLAIIGALSWLDEFMTPKGWPK